MQLLYIFGVLLLCSQSLAWDFVKNDNYDRPHLNWFTQKLDHFNPTIDKTFQQRYFVSNQYWSKGKGPIFFNTGNEGDIEVYMNLTGFMWDIAPVFQALLIFAEHRYYGKSLPYGEIYPSQNTTFEFGQLTAEQALADYAVLINHFKATTPGADDAAVIAFGGSYGGMLAAWFRIKYGHIVDGAIAASAPVNYFTNHTACGKYNEAVTNDFLTTPHGHQCVENIRNAWELINATAKQPDGLKNLSTIFQTCQLLTSADELATLITGCWGNMAMVDYPYPDGLINPLPGWPVNVTCEPLSTPLQGDALLKGLHKAANVYNNYTGQLKCFDTQSIVTTCAFAAGLKNDSLWDYQTCTEMVMPFCSNGVTDMYPVSEWNYEQFAKDCYRKYGVTPRPDWIELNFGGDNLKAASNIVFSNEELDPWHVGGVLEDVSDTVVAIKMWGAAHHLDLRHYSPLDPESVIQARQREVMYISKWISEKNMKRYDLTFN